MTYNAKIGWLAVLVVLLIVFLSMTQAKADSSVYLTTFGVVQGSAADKDQSSVGFGVGPRNSSGVFTEFYAATNANGVSWLAGYRTLTESFQLGYGLGFVRGQSEFSGKTVNGEGLAIFAEASQLRGYKLWGHTELKLFGRVGLQNLKYPVKSTYNVVRQEEFCLPFNGDIICGIACDVFVVSSNKEDRSGGFLQLGMWVFF